MTGICYNTDFLNGFLKKLDSWKGQGFQPFVHFIIKLYKRKETPRFKKQTIDILEHDMTIGRIYNTQPTRNKLAFDLTLLPTYEITEDRIRSSFQKVRSPKSLRKSIDHHGFGLYCVSSINFSLLNTLSMFEVFVVFVYSVDKNMKSCFGLLKGADNMIHCSKSAICRCHVFCSMRNFPICCRRIVSTVFKIVLV